MRIDEAMEYMYDFGDRWKHIISLKARTEASDHFKCTDGSGHGVAEDVKGRGWADLKKAYRTSNPNKEQREHREWFETRASNCDPDGLANGREHSWSKAQVNRRLFEAGL